MTLDALLAHGDVARLAHALRASPGRQVESEPHFIWAAIAVTLRMGEREPELLLIKRSEHEGDPWSGHVACPGGRREPGDADLAATAMRETLEETGIDLARVGRVLGTLDDLASPRYRGLLVVESPATSTPGLAFLLATIAHFGEDGWQGFWRRLRGNDVLVVDGWEEAYTARFSGAAGSRGDRPIVVYNAGFDRKMIERCCDVNGLRLERAEWHCAMRSYAEWAGERSSHRRSRFRLRSLNDALAAFDLPAGNHRALGDALACRSLVIALAAVEGPGS